MRFWLAALAIGFLCFTGCGGKPRGVVQGKVTYKTAPVTEGAIIFQSLDGTTSVQANLQADGTYKIATADGDGLPPGSYKVAINPSKTGSGEAPLAVAPGQTAPATVTIPPRYHSVETSNLTATVAAGENPAFDFDLTDG